MTKELYDLGEQPPTGVVPRLMHASVIRPERYGAPIDAFDMEVVPVPSVGPRQVLVWVMAAGVNFNNVWASLGTPVDVVGSRRRRGAAEDFHIGGSDASGIVWAVGDAVDRVHVGDEVVVNPAYWDETADDIRLGADPTLSRSLQAWGYETNYGSFAQFTVVNEAQCHAKPASLDWIDAGCLLCCGATAYRQLCGWPPHVVAPGDPVLIWGGAGGLGSAAIQIVRQFGGRPIAVASSSERKQYCLQLGATEVIDRSEYDHWGRLPDPSDDEAFEQWLAGARRFGKALSAAIGERRSPRIVFEHCGSDSLPTSMYVCEGGGMVVLCGATSGYVADVDLRYLWMRQKRLQGSHGGTPREAQAVIDLAGAGLLDPCISLTVPLAETGRAHQLLHENEHPPGNIVVSVNATLPRQPSTRATERLECVSAGAQP